MSDKSIKETVQSKYGEAARRLAGGEAGGCGCSSSAIPCCDPISSNLYQQSETAGLPEQAVLASLGCGNPTALAELRAGETVLDLGSGGGIDVLLSARRVGPTGKAYGLDMTDEMLLRRTKTSGERVPKMWSSSSARSNTFLFPTTPQTSSSRIA